MKMNADGLIFKVGELFYPPEFSGICYELLVCDDGRMPWHYYIYVYENSNEIVNVNMKHKELFKTITRFKKLKRINHDKSRKTK
jgi:hypothetical protein